VKTKVQALRARLRAWKQERERPTLTPRMRLPEIDRVIRELEDELKRICPCQPASSLTSELNS
jgi:hypothetical protein